MLAGPERRLEVAPPVVKLGLGIGSEAIDARGRLAGLGISARLHGVEALEGLEGGHFEPAQYATLARLCTALAAHYPIEAVAGHEHIAPGRKQDPGPGFDWRRLQQFLSWPDQRFPRGTLA